MRRSGRMRAEEGRVRVRIPRLGSRIEPMNPYASLHLPLLHTLVEERVGERRPLSRRGFRVRASPGEPHLQLHWSPIPPAGGWIWSDLVGFSQRGVNLFPPLPAALARMRAEGSRLRVRVSLLQQTIIIPNPLTFSPILVTRSCWHSMRSLKFQRTGMSAAHRE